MLISLLARPLSVLSLQYAFPHAPKCIFPCSLPPCFHAHIFQDATHSQVGASSNRRCMTLPSVLHPSTWTEAAHPPFDGQLPFPFLSPRVLFFHLPTFYSIPMTTCHLFSDYMKRCHLHCPWPILAFPSATPQGASTTMPAPCPSSEMLAEPMSPLGTTWCPLHFHPPCCLRAADVT